MSPEKIHFVEYAIMHPGLGLVAALVSVPAAGATLVLTAMLSRTCLRNDWQNIVIASSCAILMFLFIYKQIILIWGG